MEAYLNEPDVEPLAYEQGVKEDPEPVGAAPVLKSHPAGGPRSEAYLCRPILGETACLLLRPVLNE